MNDRVDDQEWLSALVDGQLQGQALEEGLDTLARDLDARETWQAYHLIGDVLRSSELAAGTAPDAFRARLMQRLAAEAPPLVVRDAAANDNLFRWKRLAGVTSVAIALVAGWISADAVRDQAGPQLAAGESTRMIRDARLDELLSAHRQLGGTSALQAPSGFLHHAAFERPAAGR